MNNTIAIQNKFTIWITKYLAGLGNCDFGGVGEPDVPCDGGIGSPILPQ